MKCTIKYWLNVKLVLNVHFSWENCKRNHTIHEWKDANCMQQMRIMAIEWNGKERESEKKNWPNFINPIFGYLVGYLVGWLDGWHRRTFKKFIFIRIYFSFTPHEMSIQFYFMFEFLSHTHAHTNSYCDWVRYMCQDVHEEEKVKLAQDVRMWRINLKWKSYKKEKK